MLAGALALVGVLALGADRCEGDNVHLAGARALNEFVYRAAVQLPRRAPAEQATADALAGRLRAFLLASGYELARVEGRVAAGCVYLDIDEGRLEKVVVRDLGSLRSLALRLELHLPHGVFNRPHLEQLLAELGRKYRFRRHRYALVAAAGEAPSELPAPLRRIEGIDVLTPKPGRWELHVFFEQEAWSPGFTAAIGLGPPDGLRLTLGLRGAALLGEDDRLEGAVVAGSRFGAIDGIPFSRLGASLTYLAPSLLVRGLRPALSATADLAGRRRRDLGLDGFFQARAAASAGFTQTFSEQVRLGVGVGAETRATFGLVPVDATRILDLREPSREARFFVEGGLTVVFDPTEVRRDRRHQVDLGLRYHAATDVQRELFVASLRQLKVFNLGWDELRVAAAGVAMTGDALFTDEEPLGADHVRGVFSDRYWVTRAASVGLEYRFSLLRDLYKLGVFTDLAVFDDRTRLALGRQLGGVAVVGLGLSVLVVDTFVLDLHYGVGVDHGGDIDGGLTAQLRQAF